MTISSRTPEGLPHRCPLCGKTDATDPSPETGDTVCPCCGHLLWLDRDRFGKRHDLITLLDDETVVDSFKITELVMLLDEDCDIILTTEEIARIETPQDVIEILKERWGYNN